MGCATSNIALAGVEQYVTSVEKISQQYKQDVRIFLTAWMLSKPVLLHNSKFNFVES